MDVIKLNLARNCLKYLIQVYAIRRIYLPYYTCPVVWNSAREENCEVKFYHIDKDFLPTEKFEDLAKKYPNLIVDNSHSFFCKPLGLASFNSLRKFFKVQNGAYLFTSKQLEQVFDVDKIELQPVSMQEDYEKFLKNELFLDSQQQIKAISPNVEKMMNNIDFDAESIKRVRIFKQYEKVLKNFNNIQLDLNSLIWSSGLGLLDHGLRQSKARHLPSRSSRSTKLVSAPPWKSSNTYQSLSIYPIERRLHAT